MLEPIKKLLNEAIVLLQKVSKPNDWWQKLRIIFPSSDLDAIKEINKKIQDKV